MMPLNETVLIQWGAVLGASLVGAVTDYQSRRIPNALTGPLFLAGIGWSGGVAGWAGVGEALLGAVLLGLPFVILFVFAGGGAGDAKLMGGIGTWLSIEHGVITLAAVALMGGLLGLILAAATGRLRATLTRLRDVMLWFAIILFSRKLSLAGTADGPDAVRMPYGIAIFGGVCAAALYVALRH